MKSGKKIEFAPYCYLVPSMLIFAVFLFYPFFKTIYLSLFMTNKMGQAKLFVGLQNYIDLLNSKSFQNSLKVTVVFVLIVVVGGMLLGLVAAVLCNKAFPGIRVFSTAYALPMAIASSSAAMIFQIMLHPTVGIVNKLLGLDINWLNDPRTALYCVAILTAWLNSGINFLYFSAGLGNIDETIYERASVDGASGVQQFFHLTLPGLSVYTFINAWNMYMWPLLVTGSNNMRTVQIGISMLDSIDSQSITLMIAGVVMIIIPSISIFIVGQKQLIRGMFSGAVKG